MRIARLLDQINRITGFNLFNTVSLEATNFTMEPTEKCEESVEVANEDAGQSQPNDKTTTTFLDWFKNPVPTARTKGYCRIEYRDPGGNTRVQHTWNGEDIVDPKSELKVKKLPDELVDYIFSVALATSSLGKLLAIFREANLSYSAKYRTTRNLAIFRKTNLSYSTVLYQLSHTKCLATSI